MTEAISGIGPRQRARLAAEPPALEAKALEILAEQRRLVEALVDEHHGHVVKSLGDGFLLEFGSAVDGARCEQSSTSIPRAVRQVAEGSP